MNAVRETYHVAISVRAYAARNAPLSTAIPVAPNQIPELTFSR